MLKYIKSLKKEYLVNCDKKNITKLLEKLISEDKKYKKGFPTYDGFQLVATQSISWDIIHKPIFFVVLKLNEKNLKTKIAANSTTYIELELLTILLIIANIVLASFLIYDKIIHSFLDEKGYHAMLYIFVFALLFSVINIGRNYINKKKGIAAVDTLIDQLNQEIDLLNQKKAS